jgi:D-alanyl-lipoteichoic acid acyltransferase DltB (MBOAT superfamily)
VPFNTLAYAKFFAVVFVVVWLLANRRWAKLLPWCALAGTALAYPTWLGLGLASLAGAFTLLLCRRTTPEHAGAAAASVGVNAAALSWLCYRDHHTDPVSLALGALGAPGAGGSVFGVALVLCAAAACFAVVRAKKVRLLFILGASYVFYAHWDWRFLPLIWGSSTADWLLGNAIAKSRGPRRRKLWLCGTVVLNLGFLGFFKYFNFGVESVSTALAALGYEPPEIALRVALPIGISFFTFESMSYVIDIYRGHIEPRKSYLEYLSFVAFFPHLVAGPIVRPRDLLPQLGDPPRFNVAEGGEGLFLIATGLVKKVAIGDYLALNLIDRVFDAPLQYSALECYVAVVAYAVQIYCDFSGYTDIAIGSALLLGVRFPKNFNAPYKAVDIADFWHRWHISLSTWLRDYLYGPLGGNRKGAGRTYVNLMLTMLLGGLWHGANWTFVAWGGLHGGALALTRAWQRRRWRSRAPDPPGGLLLWRLIGVVATFHWVCAGWIFFRAETFSKAALLFERLTTMTVYHPNLHGSVLAVLALGLGSHWAPEAWYVRLQSGFVALPAPAQGVALLAVGLVLREVVSSESVPFVYFQF